jgi:hypothetical protein
MSRRALQQLETNGDEIGMMTLMRILASAGLLAVAGLSTGPANASVVPAGQAHAVAADIVRVQAGRPDDNIARRRGPGGDGHRFTPGHRYHQAPSHWHRYHARPRDWRRRGCIIVGPVWFCP